MSPGNTTPESVISKRPCPAVRDRLLDVALQLFAKKGFEATSVREIASAAEVTKPTLYYYFKSKEGLYLELVGRLCGTIENAVMLSSVSDGTARNRIKLFVIEFVDSIVVNKVNCQILFLLITDCRRDIISELHARITNVIVTILEDIIVDGIKRKEFVLVNTEDVIRPLLAYITYFIYDQQFLQYQKFNTEKKTRMLDKLLDQIAS